jgi:hypothetical protein
VSLVINGMLRPGIASKALFFNVADADGQWYRWKKAA